jgi:protein arginine kinase
MTDEFDPWLDAVLKQAVAPAWLLGDAPQSDVAISSRVRLMRNIWGFPFPHRATREQLETIARKIREASPTGFAAVANLPEVQRAALVGSRLISPGFDPDSPGRALLVSEDRSVAIMVNEEDHLRIQAVAAGFAIVSAQIAAEAVEARLAEGLDFARDPEFGFLASSVTNLGAGRRAGVMLHLGGLAAGGRAAAFVEELDKEGLEIRGLLGESTAGTAGYVQVSSTSRDPQELSERMRVLILQEREARSALHEQKIREGVKSAHERIHEANGLNLETATRAIGWLRLGALRGIVDYHPRRLDAILTLLLFGPDDETATNRRRSRLFRRLLGLTSLGQEA